MPTTNPLKIIGEVLGQPADQMRNPVNADYRCPFLASKCVKRSHSGSRNDEPYPVCSVWRQDKLISVCPKRFFEIDFLNDVITHCWINDTRPVNPQIAHEVTMKGFGCVDFVIADVMDDGSVQDFISVELQAVDLSGSVYPAYEALINNRDVPKKPSHGVNWANVRKRFVEQLVKKGFFHHHWQARLVSVTQSVLYDEFQKSIQFVELDPKDPKSNIVFMTYDFAPVVEDGCTRHTLKFVKAIGTSHNSLMMSAMYRTAPSRDKFCQKISERLKGS